VEQVICCGYDIELLNAPVGKSTDDLVGKKSVKQKSNVWLSLGECCVL
jgi:hypothetical protein